MSTGEPRSSVRDDALRVHSLPDLARLLRDLRRREARARGGRELSYRQIAARTGWSVGIIGGYFTGTALPPTDRFDTLVCLLGAAASEQGPLATARDRVDEARDLQDAAAVAWPVPRGLPAARRGFVGREEHLAQLDAVVEGCVDGAGAGMPIAAVTGMAGVGKTALIVHWAHRVAEQFPDGQLYLDLRGYDPADPVDPADALAALLHAVGLRQDQEPLGLPERAVQYRTLLADRRVLVILDNAADAEHVRPLLPGSSTCMVVVASRDSLAGLVATEGAQRVELDAMRPHEATSLLRGLIGVRFDDEPDAAKALVGHCGGLPLALCIAADMAERAGVSLVDLVDDLAREETRLDALDTGEARTAVRSVLSWSYHALSADARRLFRLLGLGPGPTLALPAVASLAATDVAHVRRLLVELTRAHMVTEASPGRYGFHDLLRAYAAECVEGEDDERHRSAAARRLLDYYLGTAVCADHLLDPHRPPIELIGAAESVTLDRFDAEEDAYQWFVDERLSLLEAVHFAADHGYAEHTWQLAWALAGFLDRAGYWHEWARVNARVLEVANSPLAEAFAHRGLALAADRLQLFHTALDHYRQVVALLEQLDDRAGLARVYLNMCFLGTAIPHHAGAEFQRKAFALFRSLGDVAGQARASNNLAVCLLHVGDYPAALVAGQEALRLAQQVDDWEHTAGTLSTLAEIQLGLGQRDEAIRSCELALGLFRGSGHRLMEAAILTDCGDAYADGDDRGAAEAMWRRALAIFDELGRPEADDLRRRLGGADLVSDPQV
jgi:tetratricopeptide (TPR) repeat protein